MIKKIINTMYWKIMKKLNNDKFERMKVKREFESFAERYNDYANISSKMSIEHVCTELRILTHVIEKALSLPKIKLGFGKEKIENIVNLLHIYEQMDGHLYDYEAYENAVKILKTYASYSQQYKLNVESIDDRYLNEGAESDLGVKQIEFEEKEIKELSFLDFACSRHSVRGYISREILEEQIYNIVRLAQTAPSACNRQDIKVICIKKPEKIKALMELHQGASGFGNPSCIMLVASDLRMYGKYEMSLPYFDGGLFTMNLLYAIHYYGFASCPLIWEDCCNADVLRNIVDIPDYYLVNVWVAVGGMPHSPVVAVSKKRKLEDVVQIV